MNVLLATKTIGKCLLAFGASHTREIFGIGATVGVIAVALTAPEAKLGAEKVISKAKSDLKVTDEDDKETKMQIAKEVTVGIASSTWKLAIAAGGTIACVWGLYHFDMKKIAALTSICALSRNQIEDLLEFKKKSVKELGEDKAKELNQAVMDERMKKTPTGQMPLPGEPAEGMDIWYSEASDRYFWASKSIIEAAVNKCNGDLINENQPYISLADFYDEIGVYDTPGNRKTDDEKDRGWSFACKSDRIELIFDTFYSDVYGKAVSSFAFSCPPDTEFKNYRSFLR